MGFIFQFVSFGGEEVIHHFQALARKPKLHRQEFYFIRHGETDVNVDPSIKLVDDDLPLNANGKVQALSVRDVVRKLDLKAICSSPMQRAQETKNLLAGDLNVEHFEVHELGECKADVWTKMVQLEEGRNYRVCESVESFLAQTLYGINIALQKDSPTLVVAHGGIHWAMCYHMMVENHPWKIGNCQLVHFRPEGTNEWVASVL